MPNLAAIRSVGSSLADYLDNAYRAAAFPTGVTKPNCTFAVVSSGEMQTQEDPSNQSVRVLLYLYRASIDSHLRNSGQPAAREMRTVPLSVNLHFLFSFWSTSADSEHLALAWTMRQLHIAPLLDATVLSGEAGWDTADVVHLIPADLSNEDMMRIWDALRPEYHLSITYIARVVRIDPDEIDEAARVVATRFRYAVPAVRS